MSIDPTYSREALENVIGLLETLRINGACFKRYGVAVQEIDQAVDFMRDHIDDESVADSQTLYLTMK